MSPEIEIDYDLANEIFVIKKGSKSLHLNLEEMIRLGDLTVVLMAKLDAMERNKQ